MSLTRARFWRCRSPRGDPSQTLVPPLPPVFIRRSLLPLEQAVVDVTPLVVGVAPWAPKQDPEAPLHAQKPALMAAVALDLEGIRDPLKHRRREARSFVALRAG